MTEEMTYKQLQAKARELGLPFMLKGPELEKSIAEFEASGVVPSVPKAESEQPKKKVEKENLATVMRKTQEVRRYTLHDHGPKFAELAHQFADKQGLTVELGYVGKKTTCPSCGHSW